MVLKEVRCQRSHEERAGRVAVPVTAERGNDRVAVRRVARHAGDGGLGALAVEVRTASRYRRGRRVGGLRPVIAGHVMPDSHGLASRPNRPVHASAAGRRERKVVTCVAHAGDGNGGQQSRRARSLVPTWQARHLSVLLAKFVWGPWGTEGRPVARPVVAAARPDDIGDRRVGTPRLSKAFLVCACRRHDQKERGYRCDARRLRCANARQTPRLSPVGPS